MPDGLISGCGAYGTRFDANGCDYAFRIAVTLAPLACAIAALRCAVHLSSASRFFEGARKLVRGLRQELTEDERYRVADDVVH
jgi:hypothetical protein